MNALTRRKLKTNEAPSHSPVLSAVEELPGDGVIELHTIDDFASIQRALSVVINAVAAGTLNPARARVLLYGLQIASTNARRVASNPRAEEIVPAVETADGELTAAMDVPELQEPQPAFVKQEEKKDANAEAITKDNGSTEPGTEAPTQPSTNAEHVRIPPSCFSPVSEYSSGVRDRLLAARQRSKLLSVV
jgi:hypothetical protein